MGDVTSGTLRELLRMDDPVGVVTVSVGFTPDSFGEGSTGPTGPDEVRAELRKLAADSVHREQVAACVDRLGDRIDALLDPAGSGRGRFLAATVTGDTVVERRLQVPLPAMAAFDAGPVLRPLLEALDEHQPAAALLLHADDARLFRVSHEGRQELRTWSTSIGELVLGGQNRGPGPAGSGVAPGGVTHRDQQRDRIRIHRDRFLRDVAEDVRDEATSRGLDRVALVGPAHERQVVRAALGAGHGLRVIDVDRVDAGELQATLDAVESALSREHAEHEQALVVAAHDRVGAGGRGALGAEAVTASLVEGRVATLLLAPELELHGFVTDDGVLLLDEGDPRAASARREPRFVHRMIERAAATDATVTPVGGAAAELLHELGGVAALLRW